MKYASIRKIDISNGPGVRVSIFTQGCLHRCKGCFNEETWSLTGGKLWTKETNDHILELLDSPNISGLSILGGDPFMMYNVEPSMSLESDSLYDLLKRAKDKYPEKSIWLWTGYVWEDFRPYRFFNKKRSTFFGLRVQEVLKYIDVIIDGKFDQSLYDPRLKYMGSSNQRVIDVKKSLKRKKLCLYKY